MWIRTQDDEYGSYLVNADRIASIYNSTVGTISANMDDGKTIVLGRYKDDEKRNIIFETLLIQIKAPDRLFEYAYMPTDSGDCLDTDEEHLRRKMCEYDDIETEYRAYRLSNFHAWVDAKKRNQSPTYEELQRAYDDEERRFQERFGNGGAD